MFQSSVHASEKKYKKRFGLNFLLGRGNTVYKQMQIRIYGNSKCSKRIGKYLKHNIHSILHVYVYLIPSIVIIQMTICLQSSASPKTV